MKANKEKIIKAVNKLVNLSKRERKSIYSIKSCGNGNYILDSVVRKIAIPRTSFAEAYMNSVRKNVKFPEWFSLFPLLSEECVFKDVERYKKSIEDGFDLGVQDGGFSKALFGSKVGDKILKDFREELSNESDEKKLDKDIQNIEKIAMSMKKILITDFECIGDIVESSGDNLKSKKKHLVDSLEGKINSVSNLYEPFIH